MSTPYLKRLQNLLRKLFAVTGIKYEAMAISRWPPGKSGIKECLMGLDGNYTAKLFVPKWEYRKETISVDGHIVLFEIVDNELKVEMSQLTGEIKPRDKFDVNEYTPIEEDLTESVVRVLVSAKDIVQNSPYYYFFLLTEKHLE